MNYERVWTPQKEIISPWPGIIVPRHTRLPRLPRVPWPVSWEMTAPAFVDSSSLADVTSTFLLSKPAGVTDGHVMLTGIAVVRGGTPVNLVIDVPAGWTLVQRTNDAGAVNGLCLAVYWKRAASEGSGYTWTFASENVDCIGIIVAYSGLADSPVNITNGQANADGQNIISPSVDTTVADTRLVYFGAGNRQTSSLTIDAAVPSGMTQRQNVPLSGGRGFEAHVAADVAQAAIGATGTKTATTNAATDEGNIGIIVALAPIPGINYNDTPSMSFRIAQQFRKG